MILSPHNNLFTYIYEKFVLRSFELAEIWLFQQVSALPREEDVGKAEGDYSYDQVQCLFLRIPVLHVDPPLSYLTKHKTLDIGKCGKPLYQV